jgi:hypothetical protein
LQDDTLGGNVERVLKGLLDGSLRSEFGNTDEDGSGKGKKRERKRAMHREGTYLMKTRVGRQDVG